VAGVDSALRAKLTPLRALYAARLPRGAAATRRWTLGTWLGLVEDCELADGDLTEREVLGAYALAKTETVDEVTHHAAFATLPFLDFLEALVRLAEAKALPTRAELAAARCATAVAFRRQLEAAGLGWGGWVRAPRDRSAHGRYARGGRAGRRASRRAPRPRSPTLPWQVRQRREERAAAATAVETPGRARGRGGSPGTPAAPPAAAGAAPAAREAAAAAPDDAAALAWRVECLLLLLLGALDPRTFEPASPSGQLAAAG
jgi:hypothetical protein